MKAGTILTRARWLDTPSGAGADGIARHLRDRLGVSGAPAGHVAWLDGWRGLCIALVLIGHFGPASLGHLAPLGVEMFFVLSGRLMAELLIVRRQALATFVVRRASRILPLLALYVGIVGIGLAAAAAIAGTPVNWLSPVASLLFFSNYLTEPAPLLQHTWSLAVEEHSYLLLVLVAGVSARKPRVAGWIAAIIAACMVINGAILFYGGFRTSGYVFWRSDVRGASVLISFALCVWMRQWQPAAAARGLSWLSPACLLAAAACMIPADPVTPLQVTACTVFAAIAVNTIQFASTGYRRMLSVGVLTWLGMLSFSLYIWQQPFFLATKGGFPGGAAVLLTLACAIWSFARIEAPARRYLNHCWAARL